MRISPLCLTGLLLVGCPATGPGPGGVVDLDGDGFGLSVDCNDLEPAIHPDADELCDGIDNDCDGQVDEDDALDPLTWYADADGDGYGAEAYPREACEAPAGHVDNADDCDDTNDRFSPAGEERCNGADDDCNGVIDDDASDARSFYLDADDDTWGDRDESGEYCTETVPEGYVARFGDCDDDDDTVNPDAAEVWYDGVDSDCDGESDYDADADGYDADDWGGDDCDDETELVNPARDERCDEIDNNCDGEIDEDGALGSLLVFEDHDADGQGDPDLGAYACDPPSGTVDNGDDCDDDDPDIYLGAPDTWYDGVDSDCDGASDYDADGDGYDAEAYGGGDCDDTDASVLPTDWYADTDGDGYGDSSSSLASCAEPDGYVLIDGDCDDADEEVNPDATEECGNGVDDDCDGTAIGCSLEGDYLVSEAPVWLEGLDTDDRAGTRLGGGDLDGDGQADIIVAAPENGVGASDPGSIYMVLGPLSASSSLSDALTVTGDASGDKLGLGLAVFDFDGDGQDDLAAGAPGSDIDSTNDGGVYVFFGPLSASPDLTDAGVVVNGEGGNNALGTGLSAAGDLDGDGVNDLVFGAPTYDADNTNDGAAYILWGPTTGSLGAGDADVAIHGEENRGEVGFRVAGLGDVDGDGFDDLGLTERRGDGEQTDSGIVWVFLGPVTADLAAADADVEIPGLSTGDSLGSALMGGVDLDGDGTDEVLVGAPGSDLGGSSSGAAWLLHGPLSGTIDLTSSGGSVVRFVGDDSGDQVGTGASLGGDFDSDGTEDLWIGAPGVDSVSSGEGAAYLFLGSVSGSLTMTDASGSITGEDVGQDVGYALAAPGDATGSGYQDILIGAPGHSEPGSEAGAAALFSSGEGL